MSRRIGGARIWLLFPTGQKYPIRYMDTSDQYEVELPCGVFGAPALHELRKEIKENFNGTRFVR